jgi:hypothetical protein
MDLLNGIQMQKLTEEFYLTKDSLIGIWYNAIARISRERQAVN